MKSHAAAEEEEPSFFEIGVVVLKKPAGYDDDCVEVLVNDFSKVGLLVDRVVGMQYEFIELAAHLEVMGRAAVELKLKEQTQIGVEIQFEWEEVDAFVRRPDGSCLVGVNKSESFIALHSESKKIRWEPGELLLQKLESEGIVKEVFTLHDEVKSKHLIRCWALNWWDFSKQPINEIYSYYGMKIVTYFAFLGMYTKWMLFPAIFSLTMQLVDFGSLQLLALPVFFMSIILWADYFVNSGNGEMLPW